MIGLLGRLPQSWEIRDRVNHLLSNFQKIQIKAIAEVSTTYTATLNDHTILGDTSGGAFTITLPKALNAKGYIFTFVNLTANNLTIDGDGSETINGAITNVLANQYDTITVQSDGTEWFII